MARQLVLPGAPLSRLEAQHGLSFALPLAMSSVTLCAQHPGVWGAREGPGAGAREHTQEAHSSETLRAAGLLCEQVMQYAARSYCLHGAGSLNLSPRHARAALGRPPCRLPPRIVLK